MPNQAAPELCPAKQPSCCNLPSRLRAVTNQAASELSQPAAPVRAITYVCWSVRSGQGEPLCQELSPGQMGPLIELPKTTGSSSALLRCLRAEAQPFPQPTIDLPCPLPQARSTPGAGTKTAGRQNLPRPLDTKMEATSRGSHPLKDFNRATSGRRVGEHLSREGRRSLGSVADPPGDLGTPLKEGPGQDLGPPHGGDDG